MNPLPTFELFSGLMKHTCGWPIGLPILDFGCNYGNLLRSSEQIINPKDYTGIDIDLESLKVGEEDYPDAKWIHYNRYNPLYNPAGDNSLPQINGKFAAILSYSVFTQMTFEDKILLIDHLVQNNLLENGEMWFTFCNVDVEKCKQFFYNRRKNCDEIKCEDYTYLIDNKISKEIEQKDIEHFIAFYKRDFLKSVLGKYKLTFFDSPRGWVQDVVMLKV